MKIQDVGASVKQKLVEAQGLLHLELHNELKKEVCETLTHFNSNLVRREAIFDHCKRTVGECQQQSN